jgi:hypothetical protein
MGPGMTADDDTTTYLFSGYARLPKDVSHQALYERVGVVAEVGADGRIVAADCTLLMGVARDFVDRLLRGRSVLTERELIESLLRERYRGHSQGAIVFALRKVFEAVDQSPLATGGGPPASGAPIVPDGPGGGLPAAGGDV